MEELMITLSRFANGMIAYQLMRLFNFNFLSYLHSYHTYTSQTVAILDYYRKKEMVRTINSIPPPDKVVGNGTDTILFLDHTLYTLQ